MTRNRILILSYHFLPMDVIASYRAKAYLDHLPSSGFDITLVTHRWEGADPANWKFHPKSAEEEIEAIDNHRRIIRLPRLKPARWSELMYRFSATRKLYILLCWISGNLEANPVQTASYVSFKRFLIRFLKNEKFDTIISIYSPHHHHRLTYKLHKKFSINYVLDFRDLWNLRVTHNDYSPTRLEKFQDYITRFYWRKWSQKCLFFTSISDFFTQYIENVTTRKGYVIYNGYEKEMFPTNEDPVSGNKFTVLHAGNIYTNQEIGIFLDGCQRFIETQKPENFSVDFIGADRGHTTKQLSGYFPDAKNYIYNKIDKRYCKVSERVSKEQIIREYMQAHVLVYPTFPSSRGIPASKIFEYLYLNKPIIAFPDDRGIGSMLVKSTNSGYVTNTPEEVATILTELYKKWELGWKLHTNNDRAKVAFYSRQEQVKVMGKLLSSHTNDSD